MLQKWVQNIPQQINVSLRDEPALMPSVVIYERAYTGIKWFQGLTWHNGAFSGELNVQKRFTNECMETGTESDESHSKTR